MNALTFESTFQGKLETGRTISQLQRMNSLMTYLPSSLKTGTLSFCMCNLLTGGTISQ